MVRLPAAESPAIFLSKSFFFVPTTNIFSRSLSDSPPLHTTLLTNMSAEADPFLALDVSSDDYATTAARDQQAGADATVAAVEAEDDSDAEREKAGAARAARTRYTEDDFLAQKASYTARIDEGSVSLVIHVMKGSQGTDGRCARFGNNFLPSTRLFTLPSLFSLL